MKIKRLLAFIISVAMIVGMVPTFVFAKELDFEADEPETTEATEAEEEKEEPAESEDKETADEAKDEDADEDTADEDDPDLHVPEEANVIVGTAPSQEQQGNTQSTSRAPVNGRIGKTKIYWSFSGNTLTVYGKGKMPAWKSEASVPWHSHRSEIQYLYVRSGITSIGNFAFSNLSSLKGGTIWTYAYGKYSLKSIGNYAFSSTGLGHVPGFRTVKTIGSRAFMGSALNGTLSIPKNCKKLGVYAFANNPRMTKVSFNSKIKAIPNYCFYNCGLTGVSIPKKIKSIGTAAFAYNTALKTATIGKGVKTIGESAFDTCYSLSTLKILSKKITTIGKYAFAECESLTSITIPAKVKAIKEGTFYGCINLATVKLPSKLKAIGKGAFIGCTNLTSISIPGKVQSISDSAFGATGLTAVKVPGSVKTIGPNAFRQCTKLATVTLCGGVKTIGDYAFQDDTALTKIDIPASVTSLGAEAFLGCKNLATLTLNYGIKSIGASAFASTKVKNISLPDSITSLGDNLFAGNGAVNVYVSDTVKALNANAFKGTNVTVRFLQYAANTLAVTGKTATVKAAKVKKKAQKISGSKLYKFTDNGVGKHVFAKTSGNKKITVASNGAITVKKGLKKGTYAVKVKVIATGDQTTGSIEQIITVKVKVK